MKVLVCHSLYRQPGGERRAVEQQRKLLEDLGIRVTFYARDHREIETRTPVQRLRLAAGAVYNRRTVDVIRDLVRRDQPDVAHVHNVFPLLSPSLYRALAATGIPIVQTLHNYRFLCPNGLFFTHGEVCERCKTGNTLHAVRWRCYRDSRAASAVYAASLGLHRWAGTFGKIDRYLALTEFGAAKLCEGGLVDASRIEVLPHFLPAPWPAPVEPARDPRYVLYLGRLSREKGVDLLLDAFSKPLDCELWIAGGGPTEETLRQACRERGLSRVRFVGFVTGERKQQLLTRAWATVTPSRCYETFGFSVMESLAAGVPVVVSRHGALAEICLEDREGLAFRPGDAADLRRSLHRLLKDPGLRTRLGRNGRRGAEDRFSERVHARKLLAVYQELSGKDLRRNF